MFRCWVVPVAGNSPDNDPAFMIVLSVYVIVIMNFYCAELC